MENRHGKETHYESNREDDRRGAPRLGDGGPRDDWSFCLCPREARRGQGAGNDRVAIIAITLFRPKLQELWDAIASGINGL